MTIEIGAGEKLFDLAEAREHLSLVQSITMNHQAQLAPIQSRLNKILSNDPRRPAIETEYELVVSRWRSKIEQLGAGVQGLWVVEFNVGEVMLSWRYPELTINFVREKDQSISNRIKLSTYVEEHDPDWAR
ncbi:MAG: DUF2203 family protein [Pseudomonadota bacterium]